jgi:outer membrane murein-binding lipoprotein Lpp
MTTDEFSVLTAKIDATHAAVEKLGGKVDKLGDKLNEQATRVAVLEAGGTALKERVDTGEKRDDVRDNRIYRIALVVAGLAAAGGYGAGELLKLLGG